MTRIRALFATTAIVFAGTLPVATPGQAAPGDLDSSFGIGGKQITDFFGGADVAVQADGKIVVAGEAGGDFALARYNTDGSLDTSFSDDGKQTSDFGGVSDAAFGVAVQADGKIVAGGRGGGDFALARYNADGALDTSFSDDGKQTTDFGGSGDQAWSVAVQADGRIVAAGTDGGGLALARYTDDGSLDTTLSSDGKQTAALASAMDVAVQADGKIVTVGGDGDFVVLRFNPDGAPDSTFSGDGRQTTDFDGGDQASGVEIQPDGRIVAAGSAGWGIYFALARYRADGSLDATFSDDGKQIPIFGGGLWGEYATTVAVQPDGKIVAVGHCCDGDLGGDFAVARLNADGSLDTSFAGDGRLATYFGGDAVAHGVAIQADGNILVVGSVAGDSVHGTALARYVGGSFSGTAPVNSTPPTISGIATEGQTLAVNPGAWTGSAPTNRSFQWRRCDSTGANCLDIEAASATTYTLIAADVGHTVRVRETATNAYGTGSVESAATAVVKAKAGAIAGTVRSASTGSPIASASVKCGNGYSAKTASDGTYSIANVAAGSYSCTASAKRYRPSTQTVTVASGQTATANFNLARS